MAHICHKRITLKIEWANRCMHYSIASPVYVGTPSDHSALSTVSNDRMKLPNEDVGFENGKLVTLKENSLGCMIFLFKLTLGSPSHKHTYTHQTLHAYTANFAQWIFLICQVKLRKIGDKYMTEIYCATYTFKKNVPGLPIIRSILFQMHFEIL